MKEEKLKVELCNQLLEKGIVQENDIVKHSYTAQIMSGNKKCVEKSNEMITLTTRRDCVGVCVRVPIKRYKNYISWKNNSGEFNTECNRASLESDLALTLPTTDMTKVAQEINGGLSMLRIRKLTAKECMRLMGFTDEDFQALRDIGLSDSAIYHVAGDSIITTCLVGILNPLVNERYEHKNIVDRYVETNIIEERK